MNTPADIRYGMIELRRFIENPPRLWAWGTTLDLPKRKIIQLIVALADNLSSSVHYREPDVYERDVLHDIIGYTFDDSPTVVCRDNCSEFTDLVIDAAVTLRKLMGPEIVECHYLDVRWSHYLIMECYHGAN